MCGVVMASCLSAADQPSNAATGDPPLREGQTQPRNDQNIASAIERLAGAIEADKAKEHPERETKRAEDDLRAQQDMARWALFQLAVNVLGAFLIWRTLAATRDAVREAAKGSNAAEDAVEVARISADAAREASAVAIATQRPWVKASIEISEIKLQVPEDTPALIETTIVLENVGASPAILDGYAETRAAVCRDPRLGYGGHVEALAESARGRDPFKAVKGRVPIFPGDTFRHFGSSVAVLRHNVPLILPPEFKGTSIPADGPGYALFFAIDLKYQFVGGDGNTRAYYGVWGKDAPLVRRKEPYTTEDLKIVRLDHYAYAS